MAQVKEVKGPGPRGVGGPKPKVENPGKLLKRIMDEVFKHYLPHCILVLVCIIVSALANVQASLFLKTLIDDYIVPMTKQATPDFGPLAGALVRIGCIYAIGVLAAWLNARIMVNVTQGTLRNLRVQLFTHMESLPIRYFDSHPHGDIMSVYTNDVDTLRQMISQSIPQLVSSAITIVSVFTSMCLMSWQLTVVTMLMVALMLFCSKKITSMSGKYFVAQQKDLGKVNGYIEEMMEGQKVVKVFTHEQKALDGFRQLNDKLKESAEQANSYANIIMPVTAQLGNTSYAVCALAGAAMAVGNVGGMSGNTENGQAFSDVVSIGKAEVLFRCDVTKHGSAVRTDDGTADGCRNMVVTRSAVGHQRSEGVERSAITQFLFLNLIQSNAVERYVTGSFNHDLHVAFAGGSIQFAECLEFGKLSGIVTVVKAP